MNCLKNHKWLGLSVAFTAILVASARAALTAVAFDDSTIVIGARGWAVYGWQFSTLSNITISALGLYDYFRGDGFVAQHPLGIWDTSNPSQPLVSAIIPAGAAAPMVQHFRYVNIDPVILPAGHHYVIGALYITDDDTVGAANAPNWLFTVGPGLHFDGRRYGGLSSSVLTFPEYYEPGLQESFGPNFTYTIAPSTLVTPDSTINGLTHLFGHFSPGGATTLIEDFAATGQYAQTGFTTTLYGSEMVVSQFKAPPDKKFVIKAPPAGFGSITLDVRGEWIAGSDFGYGPISNTATFLNLVGSAPVLTQTFSVIGAGGKWLRSESYFTVAPGTEFTGVQLSAQFASSIANPASESFLPSSFTFLARVASSETLGDGTIMTLESSLRPTLKIQPSPPGIHLIWPTNFDNWVLEAAAHLVVSNSWMVVSNPRAILGTNFVVTDTATESTRYYRVRKQ